MVNIDTKDFCQKEFLNPPKENNVIYTWVWNEPVDKKLISTQLDEFSKAGIGGIYIMSLPRNFRPDTMQTTLQPEYLSKEFFDCISHAFKKAKELGMQLWIYDEGGWPSGGACGKTAAQNPEATECVLCKRSVYLKKSETYVPPKNTLAVFYGKKRLKAGFIAPGDMTLTEFYTARCQPNPNRVDITNKSVTDTFISNTYEAYKSGLGEVFDEAVAIFTDEPTVIGKIIPKNFFELFVSKYGYAIEDFFYCIDDESMATTQKEQLARIDYGRLIGELFCENYCQRLAKWCAQNNKKFAGHLDLDHIPHGGAKQGYFSHLHALRQFDIPGVDVIWHQIKMPSEASAPVEEGAPFFPRLASSAAHQAGNKLSLTESLAVYGDGVTPDEFRYVLNYQAIRGINVFNIMLAASGSSKASALVERPVFSPKKPGFYNLEHLNTYFKRLSYLLKLGSSQIDTALYIPCADFWANDKASKEAAESYVSLGMQLEKQNIEFDIIDDYTIIDAAITDDGLTIGNASYKKIIVPKCRFVPDDVLDKIKPYIINLPSADTDTCIRTMKRKLDSGNLLFVFNEGCENAETTIDTDGEKLYRLNLSSGEVTILTSKKITIPSGDIAVIYTSQNNLDTVSDEAEYAIDLKDFEITKKEKFTITPSGISMDSVPINTEITNDFSGEITYRAHYELPEEPKSNERYKIVLEDTAVSARIFIDSKPAATLGITPMQTVVKGSMLQKQGEIEIIAANTAANEIVAKNDVIKSHPKAIYGPYHDSSIIYERNAPAIKSGKVKIIKLTSSNR